LDTSTDAVAPALETAHRDGRLYAGAVGLIVGGRVAETAVAGADRNTLFEIGSITKILTAAAAIASGVDLDAPVEELVPGLSFADPRGAQVTSRCLLSHTSGLPAAGRDWGPSDPGAAMRFATGDLAHHSFHTDPGEVGCYSSSAISLIGLALQEMTGSPFAELLRSEILERAGMSGAVFPSAADPAHVSWPHSRAERGWKPVSRLADNPAGYPSGFLLASLEDLTRLALSILEGSLLGDLDALIATTAPRWTDHAPSPFARVSARYGLGSLTGTWCGQTVIRHGGGQLTSNCSIDFFPESDSAIVLLTNGADDGTFMELLGQCYRVVAGHEPTEPSIRRRRPEPSRRRAAKGTFLDADTGSLVTVFTEDGDELLMDRGRGPARLEYLGASRWIASLVEGEVPVGIPWDGGAADHLFVWGGLHNRIDPPDVDFDTSPDWLCGVYADSFWDDPESRITVERRDSDLIVTSEGFHSIALRIGPLRIVSGHGLLHFEPDGTGLVLGNATRYVRLT